MPILAPFAWLALGLTVPLGGTVVDAAGRSIAGAMVWLGDTFAIRTGPEVLATARTDDQGRFQLDRAANLAGRGLSWSPTLWAYAPGHHVAFVEFKASLPGALDSVRLVLGPPATTSLRVTRPGDQPAGNARIRVAMIKLRTSRPPDGMLDALAVTTDAEGRATLDGLAPADIFAVDVTVPGQLVQCLPIDADTQTVTLRPLGKLVARIIADNPKALAGWSIKASPRPAEPGYRGPYTTHWYQDTTGADGRVVFPPLAVGQVIWEIKAPEGLDYLVPRLPRATIRDGETETVEIKALPAVRVEGTVAEEPGGRPVPGVTIQILSLSHLEVRSHESVTDARGRFSAPILPGKVRFSFWPHNMPKSHFLPPNIPGWVDFEIKEGAQRQTFTPPRLRKAVQVSGRVIDEAGKPAPMVNVDASWISAEFGQNPNSIRVESDAQGQFVVGNIAPNASVKVSASSGWIARAEPVTVASAGEGEPITLVLRNGPSLAVAGRVLTADGRPLAEATVRIKNRQLDQPSRAEGFVAFEGTDELRTGRDGRFKAPLPLPLGYEYRARAEAFGFEPAETEWVANPKGDMPDLRLHMAVGVRTVAGRVLDEQGRPVAGAEVFQSGDAPRRTRGTTGADGRFQVPGVPNAPGFLFVSKEGFHFVGRRVGPNERSVDFALRRLDEPPAALLEPSPDPVPRAEERAIARTILGEARKIHGGSYQMTQRMPSYVIAALVDPEQTIAMIESQVVKASPETLSTIALARFEDDPRRALEIVDAIDDPDEHASVALSLVDRLGTAAPTGYRRDLLERAAKHALLVKDSARGAILLAKAADRRFDMGDAEVASDLVRKAQLLFEKPREPSFPVPLDDIVPVLARARLPEALKLMESQKLQPHTLMSIRTAIIERIAAKDPAGARRLIGGLDELSQPSARRAACFRMAEGNLPAARALAAEDHDPMVESLLPAIAARELATSDQGGARALLREAVDRLARVPDNLSNHPSPAVALARLLPLAVVVDPDRAPDLLWRALSRRIPLPAIPDSMPVWMNDVRKQYLDAAELAVLVARYDRPASEAVFAPVARSIVALDDESYGLGNEGVAIVRAAAALSPRTAKLMLDRLPEDPPPPPSTGVLVPRPYHQSKAQARLAAAEILGLPPALRYREPLLLTDGDWHGGFQVIEGSSHLMIKQPSP